MDISTVACDVCGVQKAETNHWLVALTCPGLLGIAFVPADTVQYPRSDKGKYEDICGHACAHTRLSQWLETL